MLSRFGFTFIRARLDTAATVAFLCVATGLMTPAHAQWFEAVIDEFWIIKNGQEIFRDSFNDGLLPPIGPDGANTYSTAATAGLGGMTAESGGKLTMTPAFGSQTLISSTHANTFTSGLRVNTVSPNPSDFNSLLFADAFEVHGLFDLSSLPAINGQSFGIGVTDRFVPSDPNLTPNPGNDELRVLVGRRASDNALGVAFRELSFLDDTVGSVDFDPLADFLSTDQIELRLSKETNSNLIFASWRIGAGDWTIMDNVNNDTSSPVTIYDGEAYTRARFQSTDANVEVAAIPEPEIYAMMGIGLGLVGWLGRRRRLQAA